ncbi:Dipeptidyl peptidase 4 [Bagarius yarrelli]|uniref:Dipeptidyl peptidase 4 n=1 Tax=Bagarius yarrelli TaxID=175774 RepID=A0A556VW44_BAGYA|nr:Dipeptidyl peptidase 4 [Bagarius yarrelli]
MFSSSHTMWWSPSGKFLAFAQFNDSDVHVIEYSWYGQGQYPETIAIPYPKAGTPNPTVRLFVVEALNTSRMMEILVPSALASRDHYLSTVTWATDQKIAVQWQNRTQSHVILQTYELSGETWTAGTFSPPDPVFKPDGSSCYCIMSDTKGFKHIHHISGNTVMSITSGQWEVTEILKVTNDAIFYVSNEHNGYPGQRNVYKIAVDGSTHSPPDCLTCTLMEDRCKYNSAYFSTNGTYYRLSCSGPGLPLYTLRDSRGAGSEIRVLEDNKLLASILQDIAMPSVTHDTLKISGFDLWYQLILPPNFDKTKKYPLLIDVYAGPCSQKSDFRFRINWSTYLASTENIIVASFDGRGSGYQGDQIMHSIYKRLGTYEVEDQITAARHFIDLGYVDKERMAIWGWSYGGYVTSMALGAGSGVFKCGMAVAPTSKWEYYDNVHFQQAAQISKALVNQQVDFESMWYTDEDHGLGGSANEHVYTHMSHFLQKSFLHVRVGTEVFRLIRPAGKPTARRLDRLVSSLELPLHDDTTSSETDASLLDERKDMLRARRHSEGTFSNDYSKYLETRRAQDFVQWLMNSKRSGGPARRHADGTYTSDVSSYLQDQAAKDFITWLKSGQPKPDAAETRHVDTSRRRHVDGSFTSDVNKVLDSIAAKEYLQWVMNSQSSAR